MMAGLEGGGAELFFERLSLALHRGGDAVLAATRPAPGRLARLRDGGLEPLDLRFGGALDLRTGPRLRRALRRFRPEVAIAWMSRAARFAPTGDWVLAGRLGGYYDLSSFRRCTHLIANTATLAAAIAREGWPEARVHHLPNFTRIPVRSGRSGSGCPIGPRSCWHSAGLHRNKGFDVLVRALAAVPTAVLVIAGEGPEREPLLALARSVGIADRFLLPGWRDDGAALLQGAEIFVCPSRHEPLGNVVLEAMAGSRPIVAAASEGPAGLLEDGRTGLLVPPEDERALADAIASLLGDGVRASRLAGAARSEWERLHAPAPVLARWHDGLARIARDR